MKQDVAAKKPGTFSKGDPRINRKGRPKTFDALRKLAQSIGHEDALDEDGQPITVNGRTVTATEAILRMWSMSGNPTLQMKFVEVAYGKVPDVTELTGKDGKAIKIQDDSLTDEDRANRIMAVLNKARTRRNSATDRG